MKKHINTCCAVACAWLLLLSMLLSSCAALYPKQADEATYIEGQKLVVEEVGTKYTSDEITNISLTLTDTVSAFLSRRDGFVANEEEREEIRQNIEENFVPMLIESGVSYTRSETLIEGINAIIERDGAAFDIEMYTDIYLLCMGTLGRERSGKLLFLTCIAYLEEKANYCYERYKSYGYEWYLEDAERYRDLAKNIRETLGEYEFTDAVGLVFFTVSLLNGTPLITEDEESQMHLDSEELLVLLKKQAQMLVDHRMNAAQWTVVLSFLFEIFFADAEPPEDWTVVKREEFLALRNCSEYVGRLGDVMPYFANLYATVVFKLDANKLSVILQGDRDTATFEILRLISLCDREFSVMAHTFETRENFISQHEKEAIERAGALEDYNKYAKYRRRVTSTELFSVLRKFSLGQSDKSDLKRAFENYMFTNAPYFTYSFIYVKK